MTNKSIIINRCWKPLFPSPLRCLSLSLSFNRSFDYLVKTKFQSPASSFFIFILRLTWQHDKKNSRWHAKARPKKSITSNTASCRLFGSPTVMTVSCRHEQDKLSIFTGFHSSIIKRLSLRLDRSFIQFYHTRTHIQPTITGNC